MAYTVICALLITAGLFLCTGIRGSDFAPLYSKRTERKRRIAALSKQPMGKLKSSVAEAKRLLEGAGMAVSFSRYKTMSVVLCVGGVLTGLIMGNYIAAAVLGVGLACVPLLLIRLKAGEYERSLTASLESAMGMVTSSYIANGDIISAVGDNLSLLPAPVDAVFAVFYSQIQLVDASIPKALLTMQSSVNNRYWRDWTAVLIECQRDRTLRFALPGIVERLGEMRRVQTEVETTVRKQLSDYVLTVLIVLGSIPLMSAMLPDWYAMLMHTIAGQITLGVMLAAILGTSVWISKLFKPAGGDKV